MRQTGLLIGLLHRVMHVGSPVTWIYGYPPYNRSNQPGRRIPLPPPSYSSWLWLAPMLRHKARSITDFLLFAMATTMASPIAWEHHYGVFFLAFLSLDASGIEVLEHILYCFWLLSPDDRYLGAAHPADVHAVDLSYFTRLFWRPGIVSLYTVPI